MPITSAGVNIYSFSPLFSHRRVAFRRGPDITTLLIARALLGYAVGGASVTAPTFISEVAPTEMRGKLTGLNEVAIVIGQLAAFAINAIIGIIWGHLPDVWRYMLLVQAIPAICLFVGMWRAPESPRWLISKIVMMKRCISSNKSARRNARRRSTMTSLP